MRGVVSSESVSSACSSIQEPEPARKDRFRVVVLGGARVGKTALVHQFLYDEFPTDYRATVEQLHRGEYEVKGDPLTLDILDTSGQYQFPAMRRLAIKHADAIILVFSVAEESTFEEVRRIRDVIDEVRPCGVPTVVVANHCDRLRGQERSLKIQIAETVVRVDWECGYVEASAKTGHNVLAVFKEVLVQSRIRYALSPAVKRRRKSLPVTSTQPRHSLIMLKRNSCTIS